MFRITTENRGRITTFTLDGRLQDADIEEVHRVLLSAAGPVELNLSNLETCSDSAVRELRHLLDAGVRLKSASPYLRMLLTMNPDAILPHAPIKGR